MPSVCVYSVLLVPRHISFTFVTVCYIITFIIDYKLVRFNELPSDFAEGRLLNVSRTFHFTTLLLQDL